MGKAKQVQVTKTHTQTLNINTWVTLNKYDVLLSDTEDEDVTREVRITDKGSESQCVYIPVQGVPTVRIVDRMAEKYP